MSDKGFRDILARQARAEYPPAESVREHNAFLFGAQYAVALIAANLDDLPADVDDWENDDVFSALYAVAEDVGRLNEED